MFGIAKPCRHHLTPELRRQYRAHMCGVCLSLRDREGQPFRAVTNVDAIGLSILVEAQRSTPLALVGAGPCPLRGMQPAAVVAPDESAIDHAAAVSLLAAAVKVRDHAIDRDGPVGRVPGTSVRIARRLDRAGRRRAGAAGFDPTTFDRAVDASVVVEDGPLTPDGERRPFEVWSAPTEAAMAEAAAHTAALAGRPHNAEALAELGRMFGRLTYLLDAVEDEADDLAAGRFNALVAAHPSPDGRREEAQRLFVEAHGQLAEAFASLDLDRPELARHLLVDQLGRRGRRIVGLTTSARCSARPGGSRPARHRSPIVGVLVGLGAWALATARMGMGAGWNPNAGLPPGYGVPPDDPRKRRDDPADWSDVAGEGMSGEGGCCIDCCPCDGDGCGCDCCDCGDCCGCDC